MYEKATKNVLLLILNHGMFYLSRKMLCYADVEEMNTIAYQHEV